MIIIEKAQKNINSGEPNFCGCFISPVGGGGGGGGGDSAVS